MSETWLIYLGLVFLVMVMFAPGGFSSLIMMNLRVVAFGKFRRLWASYVGLALTMALWLAGAAALVEMIYHLQLDAGSGNEVRFLGVTLNIDGPNSWLASAAVFVVGFVLFEVARRSFKHKWGDIQEEIEKELHRRGNA